MSILFYNYKTLHKIYKENGKFNFIYQLPQIIYSAIITGVISTIVNRLGLIENNILMIKNSLIDEMEKEKQKQLNMILCKLLSFFIVTYILLFFFWIYSASFCLVYENTQIHLIKEAVISFSTSFMTPFVIYLFPGFFRIKSLKNEKDQKKYMYNFSKFLQFF